MKKTKVKIGWILIVCQVLATIGKLLSGGPIATGLPNLIGFFIFGIIGIILLILGYKGGNDNQNDNENGK